MKKFLFACTLLFSMILLISSCDTTDVNPNPDTPSTMPTIDSLTASKLIIEFGGLDPTVISAFAQGGNLTYNWEVDFGDIIPQNAEATVVSFAGSPCCVGEKEIKCTVSNDKGSVSQIITITILE
ncbi:MAG: PKD domain-containing protein [Bacteroidetes bacterium]|jgi:hypothetical protein|nr:PKD domain-containing protein [Bacteroidota bacterium]MBT5531134.1 PKD domain-containing protein [Cytophagia bacterium]MBT3422435.1 PKD domain-containing protein [Bacteroidota bacterium]MBT3801097.1 PKD domain-containing protein [Bacteroidota bacterium]MBT3935964.1 PKD domain-containing protein [Bacteroidota bacterium]